MSITPNKHLDRLLLHFSSEAFAADKELQESVSRLWRPGPSSDPTDQETLDQLERVVRTSRSELEHGRLSWPLLKALWKVEAVLKKRSLALADAQRLDRLSAKRAKPEKHHSATRPEAGSAREEPRLRNLLARKHERWATAIAQANAGSLGLRGDHAEDAVGAAREALVRAATRYDQSRGVPFERFARQRIVGAVRDYHRKIARSLDTEQKVAAALTLEADPPSLERRVETRDFLRKSARVLNSVELRVLEERYAQDKTLEQIANDRGMSTSWVWKLIRKAESKLRMSALAREAEKRLNTPHDELEKKKARRRSR